MKFLKSGLFTGVFMSASLVIPLVGTQHYEKRETANLQFAKQVQTTNASNENNIDIDLWNDFIDNVNDHSTDENLLSLKTGWTLTLHTRFMTSKFYAENILGKDLKSRTEFPPTFMNLFLSKEFTEMEKVIIGKRILNNVATRDYLKNIGLYDIKDDNGNQINAVTPSEIYEKSNVDVKVIDTTLVMAEQPIKLEGATGYFQDWEITHPKSDRLFIVSNQDVMNDFLAILTHTKNYVELLKFTHDVQTRIFASDSTKITFVDAWNQFEDKVADLILETTGIYISLDHSFLGFITGFEPFYFSGKLGAGISSSEAYKSILSGFLGKAIFGSQDAITKEIEAFTSSPSIVKLSKETVLFSNIFEKLKYLVLESDFIKQFAKAKLTILVDKTELA